MEFIHTKVFASDKEKEEIVKLSEIAHNTPIIYFGEPDTRGAAEIAWKDLMETIHKIALARGLPEQKGFYGFDPVSKEFLRSPV